MHFSTGFQPLTDLPVVFASVLVLSTITPNISSYVNIQQYHSNVSTFIAKVAPVASHLNWVSYLKELSDTLICDLIQYGFSLNLDKSSFLPNSAVTNQWK
jgi:hypothetical protein